MASGIAPSSSTAARYARRSCGERLDSAACARRGSRTAGPSRSIFLIALASSGFCRSSAAVDAFVISRRKSGTRTICLTIGRTKRPFCTRARSAKRRNSTISPSRIQTGRSCMTRSATMPLILRREGYKAVDEADEPVALERGHGLRVELGEGPRRLAHRAQRSRPPLPERSLESRLLARRLVPAAAARAAADEGALAAPRHAGETDRRAEVHQRLAAGRPERVAGPLLDTRDVRVDRQHRESEREARHGGRGVGA